MSAGRPKATIRIPRGNFTFSDLCVANVHLAPLTLRNFIKRDQVRGNDSLLVKLEAKGEPGSRIGYGRKPFLYSARQLAM